MEQPLNQVAFLTDKIWFPPVHYANSDGLLAVGGDLSEARLKLAYEQGIFPWFNDESPILWWSPDPRMVLFPEKAHISRKMRKVLRSGRFAVTCNQHFEKVLKCCATVSRKGHPGTWITREMQQAYLNLHRRGIAKSWEVWERKELVGGIYGVDLGHVFCGESMFYKVTNASKVAFLHMARELGAIGYSLIDCQVFNPHLESLGAEEIPRSLFLEYLNNGISSREHDQS